MIKKVNKIELVFNIIGRGVRQHFLCLFNPHKNCGKSVWQSNSCLYLQEGQTEESFLNRSFHLQTMILSEYSIKCRDYHKFKITIM